MSREHGQASIEYVAIVALVGVVLTGAVALTTGGLGDRVVWALRTGICKVTGTGCPGPPRDVADLPPCPVRDESSIWGGAVEVLVAKIGHDLSIRKLRLSNGDVDVSFGDGGSTGLHAALGTHLSLPHVKVGSGVSAGVDWSVESGRMWHFTSERAADHFIKRYGSHQKPLGRALEAASSVCIVCHFVGLGPPSPPPPTSTTYGHGTGVRVEAMALGGVLGSATADLNRQMLGFTLNHDGSATVYLNTTNGVRTNALLGFGASGEVAHTGAVEMNLSRRGRPTAIVLHGFDRSRRNGSAGRMEQSDVSLAHPSAADVRGVQVLLSRRLASPAGVRDLTTLLSDVRRAGVTTKRMYALSSGGGELAADVEAGVSVGLGVTHTHSRLRLLSETTQLPGMRALPRGDCAKS